ncbi:hypothetical protein DW052_03165 [Streptococcus parasanguinis]|nr:hypothetical protein DW052_03165 [Streptococcus parasanguinis]
MNKKIILATVATIAAVGTATGAKADETNVQGTVTAGDNTSTVTTAGTGQNGTEKNETAQADKQPTAETTNAEAGSQSNDSNKQGNATEFVKNGNDIQVTNPEVVVDQSNGTGKYQPLAWNIKTLNFQTISQSTKGTK